MTNHKQAAIEAGNEVAKPYRHPENTRNIINAALPHLRAMIAEEIRDYWEACGDLIDTHNGARLAFDAIAAQIAKGPQQ